MATKAKLCPILEKNGKPVQCGAWCAWFIAQKQAQYSGCALPKAARALDGIAYLIRSGALNGPATEPDAPSGENDDTDVPF